MKEEFAFTMITFLVMRQELGCRGDKSIINEMFPSG